MWSRICSSTTNHGLYQRIIGVLDSTGGIVIGGPGNGKGAFKTWLDHFRPNVAARVRAVETLDLPDTQAVLVMGRRYFNLHTGSI